MLELNQEYTYKKICQELGWKESSGEQKKKQIREIESSYEFYHPENKKTHKLRKSYIFTKQLKNPELVDKRKNNGAVKIFSDEDFMYLLTYMVSEGMEHNKYHQRGKMLDIYITKELIYKNFGFDVYDILNRVRYDRSKPKVNMLFDNICIDAIKANSISRICRLLNYPKNSLPKGILVREGKNSSHTVPANELMPKYNEYMEVLLDMYDLSSEGEAVRRKIYPALTEMIQNACEFEGIYGIKKVNMLTIDIDEVTKKKFKKDAARRKNLQKKLCGIVLDSIIKTVENRCTGTKEYSLELTIEEKRLMVRYFMRILAVLKWENEDYTNRIDNMWNKLDKEYEEKLKNTPKQKIDDVSM